MIEKERLLNYLKYAPEKVNIYELSLWLQANSNQTLQIKKTKNNKIDYNFAF